MTIDSPRRRAILDQLILHAQESIRQDGAGLEWLALILRRGFVGFENMSEPQLSRELELRGLTLPAHDEFEETDDFDHPSDWSDLLPDLRQDPV